MLKQCPIILLLLLSFSTQAQDSDPEWPCIQILVPEIVIGVMWPLPIEESMHDSWQDEASRNKMAEKLSDLAEFGDSERELIGGYVESIPLENRTESLNKLAVGIVSLSNRLRTRYINGIKRYTRQQIAIAAQIEDSLNQLAEQEENADNGTSAKQQEIEDTLKWHQRVYDQREHAIQSLCERPVELEEKLSSVLRELAQYLP